MSVPALRACRTTRSTLSPGAPGRLVGRQVSACVSFRRLNAPLRFTPRLPGTAESAAVRNRCSATATPWFASSRRSRRSAVSCCRSRRCTPVALVLSWCGVPAGVALCAGALVLELGLGCTLWLLQQSRRELCVRLIAEGREFVPIAAVARERRRLRDPRHRAQLARVIGQLAEPPPFGVHPVSARPPVHALVAGPVRPQLHELAARLSDSDMAPRGVAVAELLVSSPMSALYGSEPELLRREVGRVRYLMAVTGREPVPRARGRSRCG
jgi:hypothetical protein